jgi:fatty-acyl-CoA synthase
MSMIPSMGDRVSDSAPSSTKPSSPAAGRTYEWKTPGDEWDAISLNYTSGTTGNPKGVVYHHRGAYLNALSNIVSWGMPPQATYLWTLPMFHCNGWCFPWTVAANSGTNVCLRRVDPKLILDAIREHKVSHYCGAPIVHSMLVSAPAAWREGINHKVSALVAAAPPPAAVIEGMNKIGFNITHVYGLTETYGPASVCAKHEAWLDLPLDEQVRLNGRQGVRYHCQEGITVMDPETMLPVPWDDQTMGEIMFRGNIVMKGYLKNPKGHRGGLPRRLVPHRRPGRDAARRLRQDQGPQQGRDHLRRREHFLDRSRGHALPPSGGDGAAVVATPDPKWGEVPCAFIELREGATVTAEELTEFCRERMARFKVPKKFIFEALPKTSTGKIQKFVLREKAKSTAAIE